MIKIPTIILSCGAVLLASTGLRSEGSGSLDAAGARATILLRQSGELRTYELSSNASLRGDRPRDKKVIISEMPEHPRSRTGNLIFDGLYAMAIQEALENSVSEISDHAYSKGAPIRLNAFQTGEEWNYVWTRDLAYSLHLGLANLDPRRAADSLLFKASAPKASVSGGFASQIVQDTGSGGSYPVSTDRVVWAIGAHETLKNLSGDERTSFLKKIYPFLRDTIEQDRKLVFDPVDGLYRGEQSFLDWREQTYPGWTSDRVLAIAMSKAVSVNVACYFLLETASTYAGQLGEQEAAMKYKQWSGDLRVAINRSFHDEQAGLYRSYLLSGDGSRGLPVKRYDLLGQSLAILFGVADSAQAARVIASYPTGPFGPPVVWPQERNVPIYHNQAIWPFVTAYWIKAAGKVGNAAAIDAGVESLSGLAAVNLSNMENYDLVTGKAHVLDGPRQGPVVNSRRQLWSVAGYLSMVQDVIFGLETSLDGIRFHPIITAGQRNGTFKGTDKIELRNFSYRGTRNRVRVHLPAGGPESHGICSVDRITLNGKSVSEGFVGVDLLGKENQWDITLGPPVSVGDAIKRMDVSDETAIYSPQPPHWEDARGAITAANGRLTLHYRHPDSPHVVFNIYRDGVLCAGGVREHAWTDPGSSDHPDRVRSYAVEAVRAVGGPVSHPTPTRCYRTLDQELVIRAGEMRHSGGKLIRDHHFENWGRTEDTLETKGFQVSRSGRHLIRLEFANGAGPVNTGISCAVKRLEVRKASTAEVVASGYLVMPQSGNWDRWETTNVIPADLDMGEAYTLHLSEDAVSRNMSYLKSNERYTAANGGGESSYNFVNIAAAHVLYLMPSGRASGEVVPEVSSTLPSAP